MYAIQSADKAKVHISKLIDSVANGLYSKSAQHEMAATTHAASALLSLSNAEKKLALDFGELKQKVEDTLYLKVSLHRDDLSAITDKLKNLVNGSVHELRKLLDGKDNEKAVTFILAELQDSLEAYTNTINKLIGMWQHV